MIAAGGAREREERRMNEGGSAGKLMRGSPRQGVRQEREKEEGRRRRRRRMRRKVRRRSA
jgi:hypothetical protein